MTKVITDKLQVSTYYAQSSLGKRRVAKKLNYSDGLYIVSSRLMYLPIGDILNTKHFHNCLYMLSTFVHYSLFLSFFINQTHFGRERTCVCVCVCVLSLIHI